MFYRPIYLFSLLLFAVLPGLSSPAAASGDSFLAGYVTAVLQRDFHIDPSRFSVNKGVVSIDTAGLAG